MEGYHLTSKLRISHFHTHILHSKIRITLIDIVASSSDSLPLHFLTTRQHDIHSVVSILSRATQWTFADPRHTITGASNTSSISKSHLCTRSGFISPPDHTSCTDIAFLTRVHVDLSYALSRVDHPSLGLGSSRKSL